MKSITIEKIPEGDAAREGARSHLRAGVVGASHASEGRERRKGANARERGLSSCVIVIDSLSTILYTFSGEQPTHYAQPTD